MLDVLYVLRPKINQKVYWAKQQDATHTPTSLVPLGGGDGDGTGSPLGDH